MSWIRSIIKQQLLKRDTLLSRPPGQFNAADYKLAAIQRRGLDVRCAVDGGAAKGVWARHIRQIYPECRILCVEPREDAQNELQRTAQELGGIEVVQSLLGPDEREVEYNESTDQSSVLNDAQGQRFGRTVRARQASLDNLITQTGLPWPDLIKLDLQGYELEALRGAGRCLERAQAVLLEVSFLRLQMGAPVAHEVIGFMQERGFAIYDIFALWHRPLDGALAQGDFFFLSEQSPLMKDGRWSAAP